MRFPAAKPEDEKEAWGGKGSKLAFSLLVCEVSKGPTGGKFL